jgi:hypothetical protein
MGADHKQGDLPPHDGWRAGTYEAVNLPCRVHGFWINSSDTLFYQGGNAVLEEMLQKLCAIQGLDVRVILHSGKGVAKSPWSKQEAFEAADWSVTIAGKDAISRTQDQVTVDAWFSGNLSLEELAIPEVVAVESGREFESFIKKRKLKVEPVALIGTIVKWRYPDAEIGKSEMADAATIAADGQRTVPSSVLKTTMLTGDPVDKVLAFYRDLLTRNPVNDSKLGIDPKLGRSVVFSDDSEGRPFAFHTIAINSGNTSTTLIITRGDQENATKITWTQYVRHEVGE